MSIFRQGLSSIIICCQMLCLSMIYVWPSSTIISFASKDTPLDRPMSDMELNFFGSLFPIMTFIATPLPAYLIDILGRKYTCILLAVPQVVAWTLISYSSKVEIVLAAACIGGLGGCQLVVAPLYIVEICQENIRGTLTASTTVLASLGMVLSYILGGYLSYHTMNYVSLAIVLLSILPLTILKESPTFLMKKNLEKDAAESIAFYRSMHINDIKVIKEINALKNILNPVLDDTPEEQKFVPNINTRKNLSSLQFIRKSRSTRRGLFLVMTLLFLSIIQGMSIVLVYSKPIFQEAMPSISANTTSIVFAMVNLASGLFAAYMLDIIGRRAIFISASVATCVSCLALGTQIQLHWGPNWMTAVFMLMYCISYTIGPGTVPFVLMSEVFLPKIKGVLTVAALEWVNMCTFTVLFIFNPVVKLLGLGVLFYFFSLASLAAVIFGYFYLIETQGLAVDVIQSLLLKK